MKAAWFLLLALVVLCLSPAAALASEAQAGGHGPDTEWWVKFAASVVNFALFLYLLIRFGKKPILGFLQSRRTTYEQTLRDARQREEEARRVHEEYAAKLANVEAEAAAILEQAEKDAQRRKEAIIEAARASAAKMTRDARMTIENEAAKLQEEIRGAIADLVMSKVETLLEENLNPSDRARLNDDFLKKLEEAS